MHNRARILVLIAIGIAVIVRYWFYIGFFGSDEIDIWRGARLLADGSMVSSQVFYNPFQGNRHGLVLVLAGALKLFGDHAWVVGLVPLVFSAGLIAIVFDFVSILTGSAVAALGAALWLAFCSVQISVATVDLADTPAATAAVAGIWCLSRACQSARTGANRAWTIFSAFLLVLACTFHEMAAFALVAACTWFVHGLIVKDRHRNAQFRVFLLALSVCGLIDAIVEWQLFGDPFYRLRLILTYPQFVGLNVEEGSSPLPITVFDNASALLNRLVRELPGAVWMVCVGVLGALAVLLSGLARQKQITLILMGFCFAVLSKIPEALMTKSYQPRRLLGVAVFGVILLSIGIHRLFKKRVSVLAALATVILLVEVALLFSYDQGYLRGLAAKISIEQEISAWVGAHIKSDTHSPIYSDARAARLLSFLSHKHPQPAVYDSYPAFWESATGRLDKPEPPVFLEPKTARKMPFAPKAHLESGYWLITPASLKYEARIFEHLSWLPSYVAGLPKSWVFIKLFERADRDPDAAAPLFAIAPTLSNMSALAFTPDRWAFSKKAGWKKSRLAATFEIYNGAQVMRFESRASDAGSQGPSAVLRSPQVTWNTLFHGSSRKALFMEVLVQTSKPESVALHVFSVGPGLARTKIISYTGKPNVDEQTFFVSIPPIERGDALEINFRFHGKVTGRLGPVVIRTAQME